MKPTALDSREVTSLVMASEAMFDTLDEGPEADQRYAEIIADVLSNSNLKSLGIGGTVGTIFYPEVNGVDVKEVAVKCVNVQGFEMDRDLTYAGMKLEDSIIDELIESGDVYFLDRKEVPKASELNKKERKFAYLAYEHKLYENFYGDFVLPTAFIAYRHNGILDNKNVGYYPFMRGDTLYCAIQDFEWNIRLIGHTSSAFEDLSQEDLTSLLIFVKRVEQVYRKTGYYPDQSILHSRNLGIRPDGHVVLLDTNVLDYHSQPEERLPGTLQVLKDKVLEFLR